MILLQASHIAKQYERHDVLFDASIVVQSGERVALVGANGAGKSTLLRILMGEESADSGDLSVGKNVQVGYVAQFVASDRANTVYEFVAEAFEDIYAMEKQLRKLETQMADERVYSDARRFQEVSEAYDSLHRQFDERNGYAVETRIRRVLDGLQFPTPMHNQPVTSLSGGQKTRLALARLLASEPDVLVLDEPTNYLDTDTLTWLEGYLQGYAGALLVVSHDRYFLDQIASVVYELEDGRTTRYVGNYSDFVEQKAAKLESDMKRYEAQQKEIARMEEFVQKNIARATTTKRAQSRRKMLERIVRMERPSSKTPKMALSFTTARTSGKDVLQVKGLVMGYPGKTLPGPLDLTVHREQRIAILGPNGMGKTSFLKALLGRLKPLDGSIHFGTNVDIGYYDQEQTGLNDHKTVLSEVWDRYPTLDKTSVRTALGRFLFRGEDVEKPVASLSGGERSRLSLCLLMLQESNVLIMDEPTNHLDLLAKEVLEDSLQDYEGTLLFVSHDRYFIDALATHVVVLSENGFRTYIGNYTDYVRKRDDEEKWADEQPSDKDGMRGARGPRPHGAQAGGTLGSAAGAAGTVGAAGATRGPGHTGGTSDHAQGSRNTGSTSGTYGMAATSAADASRSDNIQNPGSASSTGGANNRIAGHPSPTGHVRSADLRKLREAVAKVENEISEVEARIEEIGTEMTEAAMNQEVERTLELQVELEEKNAAHETLLERWEKLAADLEVLEGGAQA